MSLDLPDPISAWVATWWLHALALGLLARLLLAGRRGLPPRGEEGLVVLLMLLPLGTATLATSRAPAAPAPALEAGLPPPISIAPAEAELSGPLEVLAAPDPGLVFAPPGLRGATVAAPAAEGSIPLRLPPPLAWILLALPALGLLWAGLGAVADLRAGRALAALPTRTAGALLAADLRRLLRVVGRRTPRLHLRRSDAVQVPLAFGVLRPRILVPERVAALCTGQRRALLAHELAHVVRRDALRWALLRGARRLLFPAPWLGWALGRWRAAAERAADDLAARWTGDRHALAACLVEVSGWVGAAPRAAPLLAMADRPPHLEQRVLRLVEPRRAPPPRVWLAVLLLGVGAALLPGALRAQAAAPGPGLGPAEPAALAPAPAPDPLQAEWAALEAELDEVLALGERAPPIPGLAAALARLAEHRSRLRRALGTRAPAPNSTDQAPPLAAKEAR